MTHILLTTIQSAWRKFCYLTVLVFYRRCETDGLEHLPQQGAILLCANHANALADALIIQAIIPRLVHPVARSGLFSNWLLKPFMAVMQAVPVYRRQDGEGDTSANVDMFRKCYEMFRQEELVLIFPEGQSHSDPSLRPIKTGAARMTLGALQQGISLTVLPVGLNFSNKGKFRSNVFIKLGSAVDLSGYAASLDEDNVRALTDSIYRSLDGVTMNVEQETDLDFLRQVERFYAMRHGKYRHRNMALRFRALKKLKEGYYQLCDSAPERIEKIRRKLQQFHRLCSNWKVNSYQVTIRYTPELIGAFLLRSLFILLIVLPVGVWGIVNNYLPYILTRRIAEQVSRGTDQYDTAKMIIGLVLFSLFWSGQVFLVSQAIDVTKLWIYMASLPVSAAAALLITRERYRIWDNLRVFFLFLRKRKLRRLLESRRRELEQELAKLVRLAKRRTG